MRTNPTRAVLAIFSAKEEEPEKAYQALQNLPRTQVTLYRADGSIQGEESHLRPFAALRLEEESFLIAKCPASSVQAVVKQLRAAGAPAVFIWRGDLSTGEELACANPERRPLPASIPNRLKEDQQILDAARNDLLEAARLDHALTAAAEWILDNGYLIRTQVAEIRRHLPRNYSKVLTAPENGRRPRIYELAQELVARSDLAVDDANIVAHLNEYQKNTALTVAELWLFPVVLRVALIEGLTGLALCVHRDQQLREAAYFWGNRLARAARHDPETFDRMLQLLGSEPFALEPYFVTSLAEQLQGEETALAPVQHWVEERLGTHFPEVVRREHTREAAQRLSVANSFGSLRVISRIDFTAIFEATSAVEAELRSDPGGIYSRSDFSTRDQCRRAVERIAKNSGRQEYEIAREALRLAGAAREEEGPDRAHVAYYLLAEGANELERAVNARVPLRACLIRSLRRHATPFYLGSIACLTVGLLAVALAFAREGGVQDGALMTALGILALFPLSELSVQIVNALVISLFPPDRLAKLNFRSGIPEQEATLAVVPMLLTDPDTIRREVEKLEVRFLANQDEHLFFGLFSDFTDAPNPTAPDDDELLEAIRGGIEGLNARHPGRFVLFHRPRVWSESEQLWIGRERKRGKIEELNAFLCGEGSPDILIAGGLPLQIRYVITLDSDTQLPPGTARRLIETIAHPLNRPEIDPATRNRRRGFSIIQPRVSIALPGATATRFTRVFADTSGTDPYCEAVSDAHQDLFGEAAYHGKAIYDVRAFRAAAGDRFPAETILSHDLIEGAHAGVGLASDIELFETIPLDYAGYIRREQRWIRGDWQIAQWIFPEVPAADGSHVPNPLSFINRWRIFDNLRRSLAPIASLLLLLFGWLKAPVVWSLVVGLAVVIPALAPLLDRLVRRMQGTVHRLYGAGAEVVRVLVGIAFLPHQAWITVDAIVRVFYRRHVSHRRLLEWNPADAPGSNGKEQARQVFRHLLVIAAASALLTVLQGIGGAFAPTIVFLGPWMAAPVLMRWLERPAFSTSRQPLGKPDCRYLRLLARRTWRFFDDLVGLESNWLPPDNSQLALRVEVAQRTSPTNIGLWLTSALAATDFGYLTLEEFADRCEKTLATLDKLERYEGHLLNWYETGTLRPLMPKYVSTVDSGNLLASCWVVRQGCQDLLRNPLISPVCLRGLQDTRDILQEEFGEDVSVAEPLQQLRRLFRGSVDGHHLLGRLNLAATAFQPLREAERWQQIDDERAYWLLQMGGELDAWTGVLHRYLGWMQTLAQPRDSFVKVLGVDAVDLRRKALQAAPSLEELANGGPPALRSILESRRLPGLKPEAIAWLDQVRIEFEQASEQAAKMAGCLNALSDRFEHLASGINMGFLYDRTRRLFGVGYPVGGPVQFTSHYDLLASEARLASMVAIAKGDVPVEHWFTLSRPRVLIPGGRQALLSWSGTMFEYLMPLLYMRTYANSLLDLGCREAVRQQIQYGRENQVPWGISESAFSALDSHQIYQYRAFGIPSLALKPGLEEDLVVAPYATVLALLVDPVEGVENLRRLEALELAGPMGFFESIDFGIESKRGGERGVPVYAYMAHHQGMSLMALDDVLHRGAMRHRFHADLRVRAMEPLLFEGVPVTCPPAEDIQTSVGPARIQAQEESAERAWKEDTVVPRVHLQGNGRYALMLTNAGGGYSRWRDFDITRWRSDSTSDCWGSFLYIRDLKSGNIWSAAHQPVPSGGGETAVRFSADRAEFQRRFYGVETLLAVTVAPDDDVELRRLTVTNRSLRTRELEFTSYAELAMAPHRSDTAHPAFAKMFVQTEALDGILLARRRPRDPADQPLWTAHMLVGASEGMQYETDRARFLGRGRTPASPAALRADLSRSTGTVMDPIFSLRCRVTLEPRDRLELSFLTFAAPSREALMDLIEKYRRPESVARAFEMAWTRAQLEFRYLGIGPAAAHRFQELAGYALFPSEALRASAERLAQNRLGQSALWAYGISGDLPIVTVMAAMARHLPLVRELLLAHKYWRLRGFQADLVILNQESPDYERPLYQQLARQIEAHSAETGVDRPGGVFLRDWHAIPEEHRFLILACSHAVLAGPRGPLQQQLVPPGERPWSAPFVPAGGHEEPSAPLPFLELPYFNGIGGFTQDGSEYAIYLPPGLCTPVPWVNVIANSRFGTMVSESGLGFTWCGNSQANRLTPWHNDPVSDPQSEVIFLRDDDTGAVWTPTALPIREKDAYRARHGQGYTVFEHNSHSLEQELTVFVPMNDSNGDPVKVCRLRIRNASTTPRRLTITYFAEWVLGTVREEQQMHVRAWRDEASGALLATQYWSGNYTGRMAFAATSPRASSWSGDRAQFIGRDGLLERPAALGRTRLDNRTGGNLDPAAVLQVNIHIPPGHTEDVICLLGEAGNHDEVFDMVSRYQTGQGVDKAFADTRRWWDARAAAIQVRTPVLSTDFLLNRWLPYQTLSCRFWGRTGLYQSSGAFGFRDQLQDSMALVYSVPELTRQHILTAAARQFLEGDVQHWWHAETGAGVRTQCSDDMAWLPYVTAHYVTVTGDTGILDVPVPFIEGEELKPGEHERMFTPAISGHTAPLWEHCRRALDRAWRLGPHGVPLIGNGDWNDGMNRVGIEGSGESVWLAWFLCDVARALAACPGFADRLPAQVAQWTQRAAVLAAAVEKSCWDGEWYLRAFFDNGTPLGSHTNAEARIDSIAQSWAILSCAGDPGRAHRAIDSAQRLLVDEKNRLVLLFTPPFDHSEPHPGYIMGYPPGVRENGGQYTHGSLWLAMAFARLGAGDTAVRLLQLMNPVEHSRNPETAGRYRGEPYAVAADVYAAPGRVGQAGWTWYTGSAAWMFRAWIEDVLGLRIRGNTMRLTPSIPDEWEGFEIRYRYRTSVYEMEVRRPANDEAAIELDGKPVDNGVIRLADDGAVHRVTVWLPRKATQRLTPAENPARPATVNRYLEGEHAGRPQ